MRSFAPAKIVRFILACCCALAAPPVIADDADFAGVVTRVFDGDSFLVRPLERTARTKDIDVRLQDIDAPEKDQPHGNASRTQLERLIKGRRVFVDVIEIDQYGRKIAKVYREPDRLEVAHALVRGGHAWVNRKYAKDPALVELENQARVAHRGLWALHPSELVPPWTFRRGGRRREEPQKDAKRN